MSKLPQKAKIIKGEFGEQKDNKNAYVLFKDKEDATKAAAEMNQQVIGDKHIRVDVDAKGADEKNDFESTIFIGNLPWVLQEEDLRAHFEDCGKILNVRIIRDKDTFIGKGIAYIQFDDKDAMKVAMDNKNNSLFKVSISFFINDLGSWNESQESHPHRKTWQEARQEKRKEAALQGAEQG